MNYAYKEALKAFAAGEIPIGAVVVKDGKIVSRGHNQRESRQIATAHAEIVAIEKACKKLKSWRLDGCVMYVTLEPCVMCAGAALNARLDKVVFGAEDLSGGAESLLSGEKTLLNANTTFVRAEGEQRCAKLLSDFFAARRSGSAINRYSTRNRHETDIDN